MAKKSKQVQQANAAQRAAEEEAENVKRSGSSRRADATSRNRREQRKQEYEKQQRQWFWTKIGLAAFAVIVVSVIAFRGWGWYEEWRVTRDVDVYFGATDFVATHNNEEPILYEQIPPVGGFHRNTWQNCGYYDTYIENEYGVHALEHGAVWITYDPDLPEDDIAVLRSKADEQFVLVSPYPGMDAPVVASVWGKQIKLDGANDDRLDPFIAHYKKNVNNSPEPYGICWSGVSATTDKVPQQEPLVLAEGSEPVGGLPISYATATAAALNPVVPTPTVPAESTPESTPVSGGTPDPGATPVGTPAAGSTPVASPGLTPVATPGT
jgi:hypothetical protein